MESSTAIDRDVHRKRGVGGMIYNMYVLDFSVWKNCEKLDRAGIFRS